MAYEICVFYNSRASDIESLASHYYRFEFRQKLWILSCEEVIQLIYGTSVVLLRYLFISKIIHEEAPEVLHHQ